MFRPPGQCPVCHEFVPRNAKACPDCGACAKSGWSEEDDYLDGIDLPDEADDFDYEEFAQREFGQGSDRRSRPTTKPWWWWVAWTLIALALLYFLTTGSTLF